MRTTQKHTAVLLAAVAVVAAIGSAPVASADEPAPPSPHQSCAQLGAAEFKCESPGNAQLNDAPQVTNFFPQGDD